MAVGNTSTGDTISPTVNNPMSNLYSNGGPLTRTVKAETMNQLNGVAINSGIIGVNSNNTNTWTGITNDTKYGFNVAPARGQDKVSSNPTNTSYTTS